MPIFRRDKICPYFERIKYALISNRIHSYFERIKYAHILRGVYLNFAPNGNNTLGTEIF